MSNGVEFKKIESIKLHDDSLRLSMFKLKPDSSYETAIVERYNEVFCDEKLISSFVVLGRYDLLIVYPHMENRSVMMSGTMDGVRYFSNIECLCFDDCPPSEIIKKINSERVIAVLFAKAKPETIINNNFRVIPKNSSFDKLICLNSMSSSEQVYILCAREMNVLCDNLSKLTNILKTSVTEINATIGVNRKSLNDPEWHECVDSKFKILWDVHVERGHNAINMMYKEVKDRESKKCFFINNSGKTVSSTEQSHLMFEFASNAKFKDIINQIMSIRNSGLGCYIHSTELSIFINNDYNVVLNTQADNDGATNENNDRNGRIKLSQEQCKEIMENLGENAGIIVVRALYTIYDATQDTRYVKAVKGLIPVAESLKDIALDKDVTKRKMSRMDYVQTAVSQAVSLMDVARQRLESIPVTRDCGRVAFQQPPTGLRLLYESCEFLVKSLLTVFDEKTATNLSPDSDQNLVHKDIAKKISVSPYVIVSATIHSPKFDFFKIDFPEYRLNDPSAYTGLTHETLHSYLFQSMDQIFDHASIVRLHSENNNIEINRRSLLAEAMVEILDFEVSYSNSIDRYIGDGWFYFADYLLNISEGVQYSLEAAPYILRTFIVNLWNEFYHGESASKTVKPSEIINNSRQIRLLIREHLSRIKRIVRELIEIDTYLYKKSVRTESGAIDEAKVKDNIRKSLNKFDNALSHNMTEQYRGIMIALSDALDHVFISIQTDVGKIPKELSSAIDPSLANIARGICDGKIYTGSIEWSHQLVHQVRHEVYNRERALLNKFKSTKIYRKDDLPNKRKISQALLTTLWVNSNRSL